MDAPPIPPRTPPEMRFAHVACYVDGSDRGRWALAEAKRRLRLAVG
jgi:hypothetical protein